jgi:hypothetical protein
MTRWHVQDAEQVLRGEGLDVVVEAETAAQAAEFVAGREGVGDGLDEPVTVRVREAQPYMSRPSGPWTTYEVTPRVRVVWTAREVTPT